jgi:hypothetical protein
MIPINLYQRINGNITQQYNKYYQVSFCKDLSQENNPNISREIELYRELSFHMEALKNERQSYINKKLQPPEKDIPFYIENEKVFIRPIGRGGGSKIPFQIISEDIRYKGRVLMILRIDYEDSLQMIENDVYVSSVMTKLNLINVQHKKVKVSLDGVNYFIGYTSLSFTLYQEMLDYGNRGYVMDLKGTLPKIEEIIFDNENDMLTNIDKWNGLLDEVLIDNYKLSLLGYNPGFGDSYNLIYIISNGIHKLRYFGFDFSGKGESCKIIKKNIVNYNVYTAASSIRRCIEYVMYVFYETNGIRKLSVGSDSISKISDKIKKIPNNIDHTMIQETIDIIKQL